MTNSLVIQGRQLGAGDLELIRSLQVEHREWGRTRLSEELCRRWDWRNGRGQMKDMAARTLLTKLEQRGHIQLPKPLHQSSGRWRKRGVPPAEVEYPPAPMAGVLAEVRPITVTIVAAGSPDQRLFNVLLQIMDHGRLTDHNGKQVNFRNVILIMTTNAGAETMNKATIGFTNPRESGDEMVDIKRLFTPEFRNRLDAIVGFKALDENVILRVVDKFLLQLETQLAEKKVDVTFTDKLRKHLAKKGFDPLMGARPMQRLIQDTIRRALADELLFGRLTDGGRLTVDLDDKDESKTEVLLDIQPLPKREGRAKPEETTAG